MKIGEKIALARKLKGIQQKHIAKQLNKTPQWLSNIERGTRPIGTDELEKIASIIGIDTGIFFAEDFNEALNNAITMIPHKTIA